MPRFVILGTDIFGAVCWNHSFISRKSCTYNVLSPNKCFVVLEMRRYEYRFRFVVHSYFDAKYLIVCCYSSQEVPAWWTALLVVVTRKLWRDGFSLIKGLGEKVLCSVHWFDSVKLYFTSNRSAASNLATMDVDSNHSSPVLADPASINNSRLGIYSNLLPYSPPGGPLSSSKYINISRKKPGKLDEVCSNGWLDAMKSSSPPRKKLVKDGPDTAYSSWMVMMALLLIICHAICLTNSYC